MHFPGKSWKKFKNLEVKHTVSSLNESIPGISIRKYTFPITSTIIRWITPLLVNKPLRRYPSRWAILSQNEILFSEMLSQVRNWSEFITRGTWIFVSSVCREKGASREFIFSGNIVMDALNFTITNEAIRAKDYNCSMTSRAFPKLQANQRFSLKRELSATRALLRHFIRCHWRMTRHQTPEILQATLWWGVLRLENVVGLIWKSTKGREWHECRMFRHSGRGWCFESG